MSSLTFEKLLSDENSRVILRTVWGSHAYGTNTPASDRDTMGVFVMEKVISLPPPSRSSSCRMTLLSGKNYRTAVLRI